MMSNDGLMTTYQANFYQWGDENRNGFQLVIRETEKPTDELDWNRLRSGDLRALNPDNQDVFNMVFDLQAENERLRSKVSQLGDILGKITDHLETEWMPPQHHGTAWADDYPETYVLILLAREALEE